MAGGDALVLMPTGGGKSMCYQLPALCRPGMGLVISPLIALMDDQVAAMRQLGLKAAALHSELEPDEAARIRTELAAGRLDLLYVSPERLLSGTMLERLSRLAISVIAIDEAHCVSGLGPRVPSRVPRAGAAAGGACRACLGSRSPPPPIRGLAADIHRGVGDAGRRRCWSASFHRREPAYRGASEDGSELKQLTDMLDRHGAGTGAPPRSSIAAAATRPSVLPGRCASETGRRSCFMPGSRRWRSAPALAAFPVGGGGGRWWRRSPSAWGSIVRMCARVVHLDMPDSPEGYYQQIGRAGRDGERSRIRLLLYGGEDIARSPALAGAEPAAAPAVKQVMGQRLESMIGLTETTACRTRALLACFGEVLEEDCGHCDTCRNPLAVFDGTVAAQKVLSAIYRTGQMFGALHIVSVLRGKQTEAVRRHRHDQLALYGIGRERPDGFWRGVIRQLVARGALRVVEGEYASLALQEQAARPILRGEERVMLHEEAAGGLAGALAEGAAPSSRSAAVSRPLDDGAEARFQALRAWRTAEARTQAVPPYVIFGDATLRDIAADRPRSLAALSAVKGVGASKLERYGDRVLQILADAPA